MLYRPSLSVTTVRVFSIRAGLEASTVTPGSTAPDVSLTTPAMPLADACCAETAFGRSSTPMTTHAPKPVLVRPIGSSPIQWLSSCRPRDVHLFGSEHRFQG